MSPTPLRDRATGQQVATADQAAEHAERHPHDYRRAVGRVIDGLGRVHCATDVPLLVAMARRVIHDRTNKGDQ